MPVDPGATAPPALQKPVAARGTAGRLPLLLQMPVDGGARDVEDAGDLLDGALAGVVEPLYEDDLLSAELGSTAAHAASGAGRGKAVAGVGRSTLSEREIRDGRRRPFFAKQVL
jgi:hypothetical protein